MYNHEPPNYACPFCRIIQTVFNVHPLPSSTDVIYQSDSVTAFLGLGRWPKTPMDVLVVPNQHVENLYDLPLNFVVPLHQLTRVVALALKAVYHCEGISTRQHNEQAGEQDVWHYHVHVTPRFTQDGFYESKKVAYPEPERLDHARQIRDYIYAHHVKLFTT